jgi:hypothetical protein
LTERFGQDTFASGDPTMRFAFAAYRAGKSFRKS